KTVGELGASIESRDRTLAQRAKAHCRNIHNRIRTPSFGPIVRLTQNLHRWDIVAITVRTTATLSLIRKGGVFNQRITRVVNLVISAKSEIIVFSPGRSIDPLTLLTVEWSFFPIVCDDVLPKLRTNLDQEIPKVPDDRK